jgi:hypothetical protein
MMIVLPRQARDKHAPRETALKNRDRFRRLLNAAYDMWTAHPDVRAQRETAAVFLCRHRNKLPKRVINDILPTKETLRKSKHSDFSGWNHNCQDSLLRLELPRQALPINNRAESDWVCILSTFVIAAIAERVCAG